MFKWIERWLTVMVYGYNAKAQPKATLTSLVVTRADGTKETII